MMKLPGEMGDEDEREQGGPSHDSDGGEDSGRFRTASYGPTGPPPLPLDYGAGGLKGRLNFASQLTWSMLAMLALIVGGCAAYRAALEDRQRFYQATTDDRAKMHQVMSDRLDSMERRQEACEKRHADRDEREAKDRERQYDEHQQTAGERKAAAEERRLMSDQMKSQADQMKVLTSIMNKVLGKLDKEPDAVPQTVPQALPIRFPDRPRPGDPDRPDGRDLDATRDVIGDRPRAGFGELHHQHRREGEPPVEHEFRGHVPRPQTVAVEFHPAAGVETGIIDNALARGGLGLR